MNSSETFVKQIILFSRCVCFPPHLTSLIKHLLCAEHCAMPPYECRRSMSKSACHIGTVASSPSLLLPSLPQPSSIAAAPPTCLPQTWHFLAFCSSDFSHPIHHQILSVLSLKCNLNLTTFPHSSCYHGPQLNVSVAPLLLF